MLLGGLWHGASWNFVVWGGLHGVYLGVERVLTARLGHVAPSSARTAVRAALGLLTFLLVCVTWVFFRVDTFEHAWLVVSAMFGRVAQGRVEHLSIAELREGARAHGGPCWPATPSCETAR